VRCIVNGVAREIGGDLGLTGTTGACGDGECGACTVVLDGEPVHACQTRVGDVDGHAVTTTAGLASDGRLRPVQRAFGETGAMQCGFCTPGMVLAAAALLAREPVPDASTVKEARREHVPGRLRSPPPLPE
jgi:carbon-monoxide dehydrogenase small subunit